MQIESEESRECTPNENNNTKHKIEYVSCMHGKGRK